LRELVLDKSGLCGQSSFRHFRENGAVNKLNKLVTVGRLSRLFAGTHCR
jgi:hypothetical protein